jgi:nocturnin
MKLVKRVPMKIKATDTLRVMQWNTLSDQLATSRQAVNKRFLHWDYRKHLHLNEITRISPDILCLQEVDHFSSFFHPSLKLLGYDGVYLQKKSWHNDGCCIFYQSEFEKLDEHCILLPGNQVAIGLLLKWKDIKFHVFSTHLIFGHQHEAVRCDQVRIMLEFIGGLSDLPVILCGDFNCQPESTPYECLANSKLGLRSAYKVGQEPEFTSLKRKNQLEGRTDDYIWYRGFKVRELLEIPQKTILEPFGVPSAYYPSDHFSLAADLVHSLSNY